ncbi:hypothetical protein B0A48_09675 [Cryoendolithus antarcticus]|uniref:Heme haloperoxidase family profile domain-containing protein n=1 Tax=Cryoendolithus antarcticus TaxID=1507870 RepID=A0A1V8T0R4_9PEZI|nr:hypothetical protein B0A48_09675 [Cryoendolithus antarcticus]
MVMLHTLAFMAGTAIAMPHLMNDPVALRNARDLIARRADHISRATQDPLGVSKAETNCGPVSCPTFSEADQHITLTGQYAYASPGAGDIRGPCPGLNAAANHGYLPRNGIASIEQTVAGLGTLYNLAPDATAFLAAYAIATDGNLAEGMWSIGGPLPADPISAGLLGTGQGISYSHNSYEGDASIGRNDAYTNHGDAHSLNITKFEAVYALGGPEDRYTLDKFRSRFEAVQDESIANNPYYFTGLFSTVVVVPAAYNFVINLMSNHSAAVPSGYLDGYNFKTFFGVSGNPGSFVWNRGQERVPEDWYRRPSYNPYNVPAVVEDLAIGYAAYPNTLKIGGNTGKPNSFTGVNVADLSGGVYHAETLFQGNNFACFAFQLMQQGIPDFLNNAILDLGTVTSFINKYVGSYMGGLGCPQLGQYDLGLFDQFPGYKYSPTGPATNYRE